MLRVIDKALLVPAYRALKTAQRRSQRARAKEFERKTLSELGISMLPARCRRKRRATVVLCAGTVAAIYMCGYSYAAQVQQDRELRQIRAEDELHASEYPDYEVCVRLVQKFDGDTEKAFEKRPLCEGQYNGGPYEMKPQFRGKEYREERSELRELNKIRASYESRNRD